MQILALVGIMMVDGIILFKIQIKVNDLMKASKEVKVSSVIYM